MAGKVKLEILTGSMRGKTFLFNEHDTFILGRDSDCHMCLTDDDLMVSRHHFILEANPPDARMRDLGSLNGTYINDNNYGGRESDETPEEGARRRYPEVDLKDGDQIRVGETVLLVRLEAEAICCECERVISEDKRERCAWIGGTFICLKCKQRLAASAKPAKAPKPVLCQKCGKDLSKEIGKARRGDYVCESCQRSADPAEILLALMHRAEKAHAKTPSKIKGYEIEKKIGVGGYGAVYMARRKRDNKQMAVKIMLSKKPVNENSSKKFLREIDIMKGLRHKNIVLLHDNGSTGSAFYFVMEYCECGSVSDLLERQGGILTLSQAEPIMLQALEGLAYIHSKNIVHRDLKPGNILLNGSSNQWIVKIADLGLAKNFEKAGFSGHTLTGDYAGTPVFMPREQIVNFKYIKPVSDVWSMGATFYNMLTGRFPYDFPRGRDPVDIILNRQIVSIRERDSSIPRKVAEVIDRALEGNVKNRYQNAREMLKAMQKAL